MTENVRITTCKKKDLLMRDLYSQAIHYNQVRHKLRRNPPENWVILIFSGKNLVPE